MAQLKLQDYFDNPANALYLWASNAFLIQLGDKAQKIIYEKRYNQRIIIGQLAKDAGMSYQVAVDAIAAKFEEYYGVAPRKALDILAAGGSIAGKNWKEGVYGIGALTQRQDFSQNTYVTVNPETGVISYKGKEQTCTPVYKSGKDGAYVSNQNCVIDGNTYSSIYNEQTGKYIAYTYAPKDGGKYNADGQKLLIGNLSNDMWQDILGCIGQVADMLINYIRIFASLFGNSSSSTSTDAGEVPEGYTMPDPNTTIPKQTDGFIFNSNGSVNWGTLGIIGAGVALLLMRGKKKFGRRKD